MAIFRLSLGTKLVFLWLYSLIVTISIVATLRELGQEGVMVYGAGLGVNAYMVFCGWYALIRGWHR